MNSRAALGLACTVTAHLSSPALALTDETTGLAVDPPPPFVASTGQHPRHDAVINIKSTTGTPHGANVDGSLCTVAYKHAPQNARLSQDDINAGIVKPEWMARMKAGFQLAFALDEPVPFQASGISGVELQGRPKAGPGAQEVRIYISLVETPKGRTMMTCATKQADMPKALPQFRKIRDAVRPPR